MRQVSDAFLLLVAEASSGLTGLFLVGVFFYVESGSRRRRAVQASEGFLGYIRASTRIVLVLFGIAIGLSLTLVVLDPIWPRILFGLLSAVLVASNVDTASRIGSVARETGSNVLVVTEVVGSLAVLGIVVLPWALGGFHPSREDLTWAILLSFGTGLLSVFAIVMSVFDLAQLRAGDDSNDGGDAVDGDEFPGTAQS
jgi:hypothetical protein